MYDTNPNKLGELLRKYRKLRHLSLQYVGDKIFKSKGTISKYETGEIIPDFITVMELCNILNIELANIAPLIVQSNTSKYPFTSKTLFLYYLTTNKLILSTIEIKDEIKDRINNNFYAYFYNGVKDNITSCAYYYEGYMEYLDNIVYMNFKNISTNKLEIERVQIIVSLPLSNTSDCFNCFITGLTPNFVPIIKRGIISTSKLDVSKINLKKLKISKEEIQNLLTDNSWMLQSKLYDEFYYDYPEKLK